MCAAVWWVYGLIHLCLSTAVEQYLKTRWNWSNIAGGLIPCWWFEIPLSNMTFKIVLKLMTIDRVNGSLHDVFWFMLVYFRSYLLLTNSVFDSTENRHFTVLTYSVISGWWFASFLSRWNKIVCHSLSQPQKIKYKKQNNNNNKSRMLCWDSNK